MTYHIFLFFIFFLAIIDDYSWCTWIHLLKHKNECVEVFKNFVNFVETQFSTKVLCVRADNAKELCEGDILKFYRLKGMGHQSSYAGTPQQNGIVEKRHRNLLETSRALLFQSNLPLRFWGDCMQTTTHLVNRMLLPSLQGHTPYEKLYDKKPSYAHLRRFDCLCYVSTKNQGRLKFDGRADPCVFIGYPSEQKSYKLYNLATKKVFVSRDVVFHETFFPFQYSHPSMTYNPLKHFSLLLISFLPLTFLISASVF